MIGLPIRLGLRDAAMLNGILIHGLDYDDTHLAGVVHVSATALPTALGVAACAACARSRSLDRLRTLPNASTRREVADLSALTEALGERWHVPEVAVKLYPSCHFAFVDASLELMRAESLTADDVAAVTCLIHRDAVPVVCEPRPSKLRPQTDYEAKFSLPFVVAATIERGRFSLNELRDEALRDPRILALAERVTSRDDARSAYPQAYSGEVIVHTTAGRELRHREQINRGAAERPIGAADVIEKFMANTELAAIAIADARRIVDGVLAIDAYADVTGFADSLGHLRA